MKLELITLGILVIFIAAFAYVSSSQNHDWGGADGKVENVIYEFTGGTYQPWFQSYLPAAKPGDREPPLCLAGGHRRLIIGYFLGYYRLGEDERPPGCPGA